MKTPHIAAINPGPAVTIGKLTTALREWLAMSQQQVAIAQRTPDRNPGRTALGYSLKLFFMAIQ